MNRTSQITIKKESLHAIFSAIPSEGSISRAELSDKTGLSVMTVGKVVDSLLERGIVEQHKEERATSGRKAGRIRLCRDCYFLLIDLTQSEYSYCIINPSLAVLYKEAFPFEKSYSRSDNFKRFLKNIRLHLLKNADPDLCISCGILFPSVFENMTEAEINSSVLGESGESMNACFEEFLHIIPSVRMTGRNACASACTCDLQNKKTDNIVYLYIDDVIRTNIITENGVLFSKNKSAGDIGGFITEGGISLSDFYRKNGFSASVLSEMIRFLAMEIAVVDPTRVLIESKSSHFLPDKKEYLSEHLSEKLHIEKESLPEIVFSDGTISFALRGLAMQLVQNWIES